MIRFLIPKAGVILRMQIYAVYRNTQTILRTWGAFSRSPMPIYAVGIAQMPSINTDHTCQPDRSQMTETFPIADARALTGNGRRACIAHILTAVAHLDIKLTVMSPILSPSATNKLHFENILLPIHQQMWKNPFRKTILFQNWAWNKCKNHQINEGVGLPLFNIFLEQTRKNAVKSFIFGTIALRGRKQIDKIRA